MTGAGMPPEGDADLIQEGTMGIQWKAWGTTVRVEVTDPRALPSAHRLASACVADAERAADVDRRRAELHRLVRAGGRPLHVGPTLSALVAVALDVAEYTDGAVDPTVGASTIPLRRTLGLPGRRPTRLIPTCTAFPYLAPRTAPGWRCVQWSEHQLAVPAAVSLDLTATAKARTARLAATRVAEFLGVGALVEIGGDVATVGPQPRSGWWVCPQHASGALVRLAAGSALASCRASGIVDPLTGRAVRGPWRAVMVEANDVVTAKAAAVSALVRSEGAQTRLRDEGLHALFIPRDAQEASQLRTSS
jgi:thiamine biosynthesis lipoprotein